MDKRRWVMTKSDCCLYSGPCLIHNFIVVPDANTEYARLYDGRDLETGKKFTEIITAATETRHISFGAGVPFDRGIYVDNDGDDVETTVVFTPL